MESMTLFGGAQESGLVGPNIPLMRKLTIEVPDELMDWMEGQEDQARRLITEAAVAELVRQRRISSGRASELLGMSRWELPDWLTRFQVSPVDYRPEDLQPF